MYIYMYKPLDTTHNHLRVFSGLRFVFCLLDLL